MRPMKRIALNASAIVSLWTAVASSYWCSSSSSSRSRPRTRLSVAASLRNSRRPPAAADRNGDHGRFSTCDVSIDTPKNALSFSIFISFILSHVANTTMALFLLLLLLSITIVTTTEAWSISIGSSTARTGHSFDFDNDSTNNNSNQELQKRRSRRGETNNNNLQRKIPLVDSNLLRFLNSQQQQQQEDLQMLNTNQQQPPPPLLSEQQQQRLSIQTDTFSVWNNNDTIIADSAAAPVWMMSTATTTTTTKEGNDRFDVSLLSLSNASCATTTRPAAMSKEEIGNERDDTIWLAQYERSRVSALLLLATSNNNNNATTTNADAGMKSILQDTALQAGTVVERLALERAAHRRVRRFWKERNQLWRSSSSSSSEHRTTTPTGENAIPTPVPGTDDDDDSDVSIIAKEADEEEPTLDSVGNHDNVRQIINVMLEYGLSGKDVCEIFVHSPGIAFMQPRRLPVKNASLSDNGGGESLQDTLDRVVSGLLMGRTLPHELKMRKYDSRKVIRNTPGLLSVRGSRAATKMVQLLTALGVSPSALVRDKSALPVLLSRDPAHVFRLVAFLASDAVRMPIDKIGPLLRRSECQDLLDAIAPVPKRIVRQQQQYRSADVTLQIRREVINDVYRRMSQTVKMLRDEIGTHDLGQVIAAFPSVLLLDASRQVLPTANYLMNELGICQDDLPSVLQLYPALLRMDVEQMRNVVSYLQSLEVSDDNLGSIFRSFPVLLTMDIEHDMEPVVEFLRSIGVSNVGRFIARLPPVLCYSVERELQPKFDFLTTVCTEPRFEVSKFPAFFSYPLERVIKTRYEYLRDVKRIPTPLLSLDHVLCSGDKDFAVRVAHDPDGSGYARFVEARRKSVSTTKPLGPVSNVKKSTPSLQSESNHTATADTNQDSSSDMHFSTSIAMMPT